MDIDYRIRDCSLYNIVWGDIMDIDYGIRDCSLYNIVHCTI